MELMIRSQYLKIFWSLITKPCNPTTVLIDPNHSWLPTYQQARIFLVFHFFFTFSFWTNSSLIYFLEVYCHVSSKHVQTLLTFCLNIIYWLFYLHFSLIEFLILSHLHILGEYHHKFISITNIYNIVDFINSRTSELFVTIFLYISIINLL